MKIIINKYIVRSHGNCSFHCLFGVFCPTRDFFTYLDVSLLCENMFQCSRTVLDFPELFQNYANNDFQNFFPLTVIEPASRALLEQIKDFANPIFVLEQ